MNSEVCRERKISSTYGCHERMTICSSMENHVFQIDVKAANNFASVSPNSDTFWMEIGIDSWGYDFNIIVRNIFFFFFGLRLERGLNYGCINSIGFLFLNEGSLRMLIPFVNHNVFRGYS